MPRKGEVRKREVLPDPKFGEKLVTKFVNTIMNQGKKSVAESILYRSLDIVAAKTKEDSAPNALPPPGHPTGPSGVSVS